MVAAGVLVVVVVPVAAEEEVSSGGGRGSCRHRRRDGSRTARRLVGLYPFVLALVPDPQILNCGT